MELENNTYKFNIYKNKEFVSIINETKDNLTEFLEFCNQSKERYYKSKEISSEILKHHDEKLHDLEFEDLSYHEIARLGRELRDLRRNRREYKNDYLLVEHIKDFAKSDDNINLIRELIDRLEKLSLIVDSDVKFILSQKFLNRSTVDNISNMKIDNRDLKNIINEDIVMLNRVLNKYVSNAETHHVSDNVINTKLQLSESFSLSSAKTFICGLSNNLELFYKPRLLNVICIPDTSDMLMTDDIGKKILKAVIKINLESDGSELYILNITLREGNGKSKSNKSKKRGKGGSKSKK